MRGRSRSTALSTGPFSWIASALVAFAIGAALSTTAQAAPSLSVRAQRILLPLVDEDDLDSGWVENDPARGTFALEIDVRTSSKDVGPWALYIRPDGSSFNSGALDKPCSDLEWKLDDAPASSFARLEEEGAIIIVAPKGGNLRVALDVRVRVDWMTGSGPLTLGVSFDVAPY